MNDRGMVRLVCQANGHTDHFVLIRKRTLHQVELRRNLAHALRRMGWGPVRIGRAFGCDHSSVYNLLHTPPARKWETIGTFGVDVADDWGTAKKPVTTQKRTPKKVCSTSEWVSRAIEQAKRQDPDITSSVAVSVKILSTTRRFLVVPSDRSAMRRWTVSGELE